MVVARWEGTEDNMAIEQALEITASGKVTRPKYQAVCYQCYTCCLTPPTTKKAANLAATSHLNAYHHQVGIQEVKAVANTSKCSEAAPPIVEYASSETAYGRTVPASFAIKVF